MNQANRQSLMRPRPSSRAVVLSLLGYLVALIVCYVLAHGCLSLISRPRKRTPWLTQEKFYQLIESGSLAVPGGSRPQSEDGSRPTIPRDQIESLVIERAGDAPESEGFLVKFVIRNEQGPLNVEGMVSLHTTDGVIYPIVNLGHGWRVTTSSH